jgi:hypothetical protein
MIVRDAEFATSDRIAAKEKSVVSVRSLNRLRISRIKPKEIARIENFDRPRSLP